MGEVAYDLALHAELSSVHLVFHVSMLKKSLGYPTSIIPIDGWGFMKTFIIKRYLLRSLTERLRG